MSPAQRFYDLDYCLAFHCAPVLAGIKAANMVSLPKKRHHNLHTSLVQYQKVLASRGICIFSVTECSERILLLLYNEHLLRKQIGKNKIRAFLCQYGYPPLTSNISAVLEHLKCRMQAVQGGCPHEIGVFLGYPLSDVLGFIQNRGNTYQFSGYWKVYSNPESAKRLFATYDAVRDFYCKRVLRGERIHNIEFGGCCS